MKSFASTSSLPFLLLLSSKVLSLFKQVLSSFETLKSRVSLRLGGLELIMQKDCNLVLSSYRTSKVSWESYSAKGYHHHCTIHLTNHGALGTKNGNHIFWHIETYNNQYMEVYILLLMPPDAIEVVNSHEVAWSSAFSEPERLYYLFK